jgi:hypothetical protein
MSTKYAQNRKICSLEIKQTLEAEGEKVGDFLDEHLIVKNN